MLYFLPRDASYMYIHNINTIVPHNQVKRDTSQLHGVPQFATGHMTGKGKTMVHWVPVTSLGAYALAAAEFVADHSRFPYARTCQASRADTECPSTPAMDLLKHQQGLRVRGVCGNEATELYSSQSLNCSFVVDLYPASFTYLLI
jgi:hypothetical protein